MNLIFLEKDELKSVNGGIDTIMIFIVGTLIAAALILFLYFNFPALFSILQEVVIFLIF